MVFVMTATAENLKPVKPTDQLRTEMIDLIGTTCPLEYNVKDCRATIFFTINSNDEIEILNIISKNKNAKPYFTKKLSNKKVSRPPYDVDQIYFLPVRLVNGYS